MKKYQIQIQAYNGEWVDYFGQKIFTGPFDYRKEAHRKRNELEFATRRNHFKFRVDERTPQGYGKLPLAA